MAPSSSDAASAKVRASFSLSMGGRLTGGGLRLPPLPPAPPAPSVTRSASEPVGADPPEPPSGVLLFHAQTSVDTPIASAD